MPRPRDLTAEQVAAEAAELAPRRREADRAAGSLFSEIHALLDATEEDLQAMPPEEAEYVRQYWRQHDNPSQTGSGVPVIKVKYQEEQFDVSRAEAAGLASPLPDVIRLPEGWLARQVSLEVERLPAQGGAPARWRIWPDDRRAVLDLQFEFGDGHTLARLGVTAATEAYIDDSEMGDLVAIEILAATFQA